MIAAINVIINATLKDSLKVDPTNPQSVMMVTSANILVKQAKPFIEKAVNNMSEDDAERMLNDLIRSLIAVRDGSPTQ